MHVQCAELCLGSERSSMNSGSTELHSGFQVSCRNQLVFPVHHLCIKSTHFSEGRYNVVLVVMPAMWPVDSTVYPTDALRPVPGSIWLLPSLRVSLPAVCHPQATQAALDMQDLTEVTQRLHWPGSQSLGPPLQIPSPGSWLCFKMIQVI